LVLAGVVGGAELLVLVVRGHVVWALVASPITAGVVLVVVAGTARLLGRSPRPDTIPEPKRPPPQDDDFNLLIDRVMSVSNRIQEWQVPELDDNSRAQARRAEDAIDGIKDIMDEVMGRALADSAVLQRIAVSVRMVENDARRRRTARNGSTSRTGSGGGGRTCEGTSTTWPAIPASVLRQELDQDMRRGRRGSRLRFLERPHCPVRRCGLSTGAVPGHRPSFRQDQFHAL
jgi:hypothetical protein